MDISSFSEIQIITFALVLIRVSAFFVAFPLVEGSMMPNTTKILLALACTFVIYPVVNAKGLSAQSLDDNLILLCIKEVLAGIIVGFVARFFFHSISICGEIATISVGLSADQLFMPNLDRRVTILEQYQLLLGALFFLAMNGHHIFIEGLVESFNFIQIHETNLSFVVFRDMTLLAQEIIILGIKLSAPILGAIFVSNIALGIIGRAVPQINVLVTSWPVNITLGFGILIISLPLFLMSLRENLNWGAETLFEILKRI